MTIFRKGKAARLESLSSGFVSTPCIPKSEQAPEEMQWSKDKDQSTICLYSFLPLQGWMDITLMSDGRGIKEKVDIVEIRCEIPLELKYYYQSISKIKLVKSWVGH